MSSDRLIVLITGANTGLGYQTARHLALTGKYIVFIGARSTEKANSAIDSLLKSDTSITKEHIIPLLIDITDDSSITSAVAAVKDQFGKLDILVNNAAISKVTTASSPREELNTILNTNVTSTHLVTEAFVPLLLNSVAPRIVFVSSTVGSLTITQDGPAFVHNYTEYSVSKAALNMLVLYCMDKYKERKVTVVAVSPGYCATNLNDFSGMLSAEHGGLTIAKAVMDGDFESVNGTFRERDTIHPW